MRILLLMLFSAFVFVGCNSSPSRTALIDDSNVIAVKIEKIEEKPVVISNFIDSVEFVILETVPESLIADIGQVMLVDSLIVVTDKKIACLFFFDHNGKYLYKINRKGRGPGEYLDITKALWDEKKRELIIWDLASRSLLFYTLDGTFIRSIDDFNERTVIRDITTTLDGGYLCYREDISAGSGTDNLSGLWKTDSLGNFEQFLIERTTMYPNISSQYLFNLYPVNEKGKIGLIDQYSYDIYRTDGRTISKYMSFDLPRKRLADFPEVEGIEVEEPFFSLHHHTEKGDMVFTEWIGSDGYYFVSLYSKRDKTFQTGRNASVKVDDQFVSILRNVAINSPSVMASVILPITILSILENPNVPDEMKTVFEKLAGGKEKNQIEGMNPILMLLHVN